MLYWITLSPNGEITSALPFRRAQATEIRDDSDPELAAFLVPTPAGLAVDAARVEIDRAAEGARLQFISPGAGQAMAYQRKADQARACLAAYDAQTPPPAGLYPALEAEVGITAADVVGVATVVAGLAEAWAAVADAIEAIRLAAKRDVAAAASDEDRTALVAALVWPAPG